VEGAQLALRALIFVVIPALLAIVVTVFFVPRNAPGLASPLAVVARAGHAYPVLLCVALFLLFSLLARYWRFQLPGWRYLSELPAGLAVGATADRLPERAAAASLWRWLDSPGTRRRLLWTVGAERGAEIDARRGDLWRGLEAGDDLAVEGTVRVLEQLAAPALEARRRRDVAALVGTVALAAGAALLLRAKVVEAYSVLSASMLPTLEPGDEIVGNKLAFRTGAKPRRGDVIVFRSAAVALGATEAPPVLVKRVLGLPGDRVRMRAGIPVINGWLVPTCDVGPYIYPLPDGQGGAFQGRLLVEFLDDRAYLTVHSITKDFASDYEVKAGELFVLGDNRSNSFDSRAWNGGKGGGVPLGGVEARAQWFLVGTHLDGRADWRRVLRPLDAAATFLQAEGIDRRPLDEGIAKCLENPPKQTHPPSPGTESAPPPAAPPEGKAP
jgi:signal peptidase I